MACLSCATSLHSECESAPVGALCCCVNSIPTSTEAMEVELDSDSERESDDDWHASSRKHSHRDADNYVGYKRDTALKDQQSTGRKRAAILYPLDPEASCEWRGLASAGGGNNPIIGCIDGKQTHRHHGPNKNTLANEDGNVHRICVHCHNRWHAANDSNYDPDGPFSPHDPNTRATPEEVIRSDINWRSRNIKHIRGA